MCRYQCQHRARSQTCTEGNLINLQDLVLCNGTLRQPFEVGLLPALSELPARSAFMAYPQKARRRVAIDSVRLGRLQNRQSSL
jgi:hypothetical protein